MFSMDRSSNIRVATRSRVVPLTMVFTLLLCSVWLVNMVYLPGASPAAILSSPHVEFGKLPLAFTPNLGQTDPAIYYQVRDLRGMLSLTADGLILSQQSGAALQMTYLNSNTNKTITGLESLSGKTNYIIGNKPEQWHLNLPTYSSILYKNLYPGIDLQYQGKSGTFESIYQIASGADPSLIRWQQTGVTQAQIDSVTGDLLLTLAGSNTVLTEQAPKAWQIVNGKQTSVPIQYKQLSDGIFGFALGTYDPSLMLTIDPTLSYSTFLGGSNMDDAEAVVLDADGNIYITGTTNSPDYPVQSPLQSDKSGADDIFVTKLNPAGDTMIFSTYLGGSDDDEGNALAVDPSGNVYLAGQTFSDDFPTANAYADQCTTGGGFCMGDAFLAKLNPTGDTLTYGTYLGGSNPDDAMGVAVGETGMAYLTGTTMSKDFPTMLPFQDKLKGWNNAYITKLDTMQAGMSSLVYSTYMGGTDSDFGTAITLAKSDQPVIVGHTTSGDFPVQSPLQSMNKGNSDAFITALDIASNSLVYSTFLGGSDQEFAYKVAANSQGDAYVIGTTKSTDFPVVNAVQTANGGKIDAFITGIMHDGSAWLLSTYMGGSEEEYGYGITLDTTGAIYITGATHSADFPANNEFQAYTGNGDAFVAKIIPGTPGTLEYSTLLGGADADLGTSIAVDNAGNSYITGITLSADFPLQDPLQADYTGKGDAFLAKIADEGANPPIPTSTTVPPVPTTPPPALNPLFASVKIGSQTTLSVGETLTFTINLHNSSTADVIADVVDPLPDGLDYVAASASNDGVYDDSSNTLTWEGITVPATQEVKLTFDVTTTVEQHTLVVNNATITDSFGSIVRSFPVVLGTETPPQPSSRPVIDQFTIGDQDILGSQEVILHTKLNPDSQATYMYLREWQINSTPFLHWEVVKSEGWVPFQADYPWTLGTQAGVHYVAVWVADENYNTSILDKNALDFASLLPTETNVPANGLVSYLAYYGKDTAIDATLTPTSGNTDLFVWYPDNFFWPNHISMKSGTGIDEVHFTAPQDGVYLFLVYGMEESTYNLSITPGGGPTSSSTGTPITASKSFKNNVHDTDQLFIEPPLIKIGFDPLASGTTTVPPVRYTTYIPIIGR